MSAVKCPADRRDGNGASDPAEVSRGHSTGGIEEPGRAEHQVSGTLAWLVTVATIAATPQTRA